MDESYEDPRYNPSQGRWVTYNADAGAVWEPLTVAAPLGQYVGSGDAGGQWVDYSAQERAAVAAQQEADRQAQLQAAAAYVAANPLPISGDQIATQYGNQDVSYFNPIAAPGQPVTGSTQTQMVDPLTKELVYLSNPNDPFSYTYENTGTPAIGGTLEQQAAMYKPIVQKGVFGSLGGDLLSALKDPYFRNFALAAATMAAGAALAPAASAGSAGTAAAGTAGSSGFGSTLTGLGATGAEAAAGFGSVGSALGAGAAGAAGAAGLANPLAGDIAAMFPGGLPAAPSSSTLGGLFASGADVLAGPYGSLIKGGLTLGGLAAASALKPKTDTSGTGQSGMTAEQLSAIVSLMPSMVGQYTSQAGQGSTGQPVGGYNPGTGQSLANLFPGFSLPTQGPFYGAGRFGDNYNPSALTSLV